MVEYLTPEMLTALIGITIQERSDMEEYKKRGKGRVIPEINKRGYITMNYAEWLCKYLRRKMKNGGLLNLRATINALENTDWAYHSYNHLAYATNEDLSRMLLKNKFKYMDPENAKTRLEMLDEQAEYLSRATTWLIGELEGILEGDK